MEITTSAVGLYGTMAPIEQEYRDKEAVSGTFTAALSEAAENAESGTGSMDAIFEEAAWAYDISVDLLKAVAKAESNFNANAVSSAGAMGVMQLMPGTANSLGVTNPFDARQNILGGAKYLKGNLDRFGGNVSLALAAYNAGPGSVEKYGGIPPYAETQNYVQKVLSYLEGSPLFAGNVTSGYGTSAMTGLGGIYGSSALGSLYGTSGYSGYGNSAYGTSAMSNLGGMYGTWGLSGMGSGYGMSAMTGMGSLFGMSTLYGSSANMMGMLYGTAQGGSQDTVTIDKSSFYNLVELLRLQMLMNASSQVGSITI